MNSNEGKKVFIYKNKTDLTKTTYESLVDILSDNGFTITDDHKSDPDLMICIGGDGTFLRFIQSCRFPNAPILGINTGHLGFFQELMPDQIEFFIKMWNSGDYTLQKVACAKSVIYLDDEKRVHHGLNEILIRGPYTHLTHFKVMIGDTFIQNFSGDGILFSTPVGSTAYNYSLGGAIVAPDVEVMQMTPVAPMDTNAYRCFRSSIMYSFDSKVTLIPAERNRDDKLMIVYDGQSRSYRGVRRIEISRSEKVINIIRFSNYDYWMKLTSKLI